MEPTPFAVDSPTIAISATSNASTPVAVPGTGSVLRCVNEGPNASFLAVSISPTNATLPSANSSRTSTAILPGEDVVFTAPHGSPANPVTLYVSAICRAASTATLLISSGEGI